MSGFVLPGWFCPNPQCKIFNGEAKSVLTICRNCDTAKPILNRNESIRLAEFTAALLSERWTEQR